MPDCYHISLTCDLARLCFSGPYETLGKYLWKQDTLHLSNFLFYIFGFVNGAERAYSQVGQTQRRSVGPRPPEHLGEDQGVECTAFLIN